MKKLKYFIPAILWMIFIFIMSQTNGNDSSNQSNFFVEIIRKTAHMSEYALLLFFIYYGFKKTITHQYTLLLSLLITFLYACSDEFHQLFIPGRSGQFVDVLIDTAGGVFMLLIIYLWQKKANR